MQREIKIKVGKEISVVIEKKCEDGSCRVFAADGESDITQAQWNAYCKVIRKEDKAWKINKATKDNFFSWYDLASDDGLFARDSMVSSADLYYWIVNHREKVLTILK